MQSIPIRRRAVKSRVILLTRRIAFVQCGPVVHQVFLDPASCSCGRKACAHVRAVRREGGH